MSTTGSSPETNPSSAPASTPAPTSGAAAESGEDPRGVPRQRHSGGNVQSMVISMAVILAMVAVVVWLLPRPNAIEQPAIDVGNAASGQAADLTFVPAVPVGVEDWKATSANVNRSTDGVVTWHVGYITDDQVPLALEVARDTTPTWFRAQTQSSVEDGEQQVAGLTWERYLQEDRDRYTLVRTQDGLTVLVTGNGSYDVVGELAAATVAGWDAEGAPWGEDNAA